EQKDQKKAEQGTPIFAENPLRNRQSVAVLGMRNGTSQSPFRPALGRQLVRAAD
ncbi:MAG: hypothetical protein, partial [Olavius algarvensis Gamma 1 endosymbiont]